MGFWFQGVSGGVCGAIMCCVHISKTSCEIMIITIGLPLHVSHPQQSPYQTYFSHRPWALFCSYPLHLWASLVPHPVHTSNWYGGELHRHSLALTCLPTTRELFFHSSIFPIFPGLFYFVPPPPLWHRHRPPDRLNNIQEMAKEEAPESISS